MALYQLRDMRATVLYEGSTYPQYDVKAMRWVTPDRIVIAPNREFYCVVEVGEAPLQTANRTLTHKQYMERFSVDELGALYSAAVTNISVQVWLKMFELADDISLDDPLTLQGLNEMESLGLLTPGRAAEILA